jgi:hypothetical protein
MDWSGLQGSISAGLVPASVLHTVGTSQVHNATLAIVVCHAGTWYTRGPAPPWVSPRRRHHCRPGWAAAPDPYNMSAFLDRRHAEGLAVQRQDQGQAQMLHRHPAAWGPCDRTKANSSAMAMWLTQRYPRTRGARALHHINSLPVSGRCVWQRNSGDPH